MDFASFGLSAPLLRALEGQGLAAPTPIQTQAIPEALKGRDVMGLAQTGSGKTAAFGLPMLDALLKEGRKASPKQVRGLVLAPTRELARQIHDVLEGLARGTHLKFALVTGGVGFTPQIERLGRGVSVLIATPGRLLDLADRRAVDLSATRFLVLDEADQMLDMGFIHALRRIAALLPRERQTMLFSATMPKDMEEVARAYLTDPVRVQVNPPGQAVAKIEQSLHFVARAAKTEVLIELLDAHRDDRALVFGRTKHGSEKLARQLEQAGYAVAAIHGNKSQGQRDRAVAAFREGEVRVLVATDVAARGLDIPGVAYVYNYDLPNVPESYVHRIGRTARAGADGAAVALVAPDEMDDLRAIEKAMKAQIPVASGAPWTPEPKPARGGGRGQKAGGQKAGARGAAAQGGMQGGAQRGSHAGAQPRGAERAGELGAKPAPKGPRWQRGPKTGGQAAAAGRGPDGRPGGHGAPRRGPRRPQTGRATA
jgi:ATP-dependent RNA helicase RhlE